ncbi:MAG: outer rane biosis protein BamB, partial [Verrucomicrobiales bacterium]|nr:outer rane biosis protein BamB [Verrucomicrobiales bacterium]
IFEQWISLTGRIAHIHFKMNFSGSQPHPIRDHEVPAFFVEPEYSNLLLYSGDKPWSNGKISESKPGWPNESRTATENWAAYVNPQGYGIGAYFPLSDHLTCYRYGDGNRAKGACSYFAPLTKFAITPGLSFEYDLYLTAGTGEEIRSTFFALAKPTDTKKTTSNQDWPEFRGPTGQGYSTSKSVPITWSAENNVAWKNEIPGNGWSSPIIVGDKVYVTAAQEDDNGTGVSLIAICMEAASGKQLWNKEIFRPDSGAISARHPKNSLASGTPIIRDGKMYVHFGHMGTAALDLDGEILWTQTDLKYSPIHGNGGSPILVDDMLVFSVDPEKDPYVVALDIKTGKVRWKTSRESPVRKKFSFSTPLLIEVDRVKQIISPGSGFVGAYAPYDGKELWRVNYGEGYSVVPRPVYQQGLLYIGSGFDQASLYAIDPTGAVGDVTKTKVLWTIRKGAPLTPSMIVVGDDLYFASDSGIATCTNAKTGEVYWSERLGGGFSASPIVAENRIYFLNESGIMFVVKAAHQFEIIAKNEIGERTLASPATTDGAIFIRGEKHLFRIGK